MKALRIVATCSLSIMLLTQSLHALDDNTLVGFVREIADTGEDKDQVLLQHIYKLIQDDGEARAARLTANRRWQRLLKIGTKRYPKLAHEGTGAINAEVNKLIKDHETFIRGAGIELAFGAPPAGP